ncbi:hypothetical protein CsSME_00053276 [Camellia sinensis var. sinensis]
MDKYTYTSTHQIINRQSLLKNVCLCKKKKLLVPQRKNIILNSSNWQCTNNTHLLRLVQILGTSMTTKMWEVTVDHARTCTLDNRLHLYFPINSQKKTGVVFNAVGQVMGLLLDYCYILIDNLPELQKACFSYHINLHSLLIFYLSHFQPLSA